MFDRDLMLSRSQFGAAADFGRSRFSGPVYMDGVLVSSVLDFTRAALRNKLRITATICEAGSAILLRDLDFVRGTSDIYLDRGIHRGNVLHPRQGRAVDAEGQVVFQDIPDGIERVSLLHTDVFSDRPNVRFVNVHWKTNPREFLFDAKFVFIPRARWHQELGESAKVNELPDLYNTRADLSHLEPLVRRDVERIAREIRRSYEAYGSYSAAGDYHIAEMEYRRVQAKGLNWFLLWCYRTASQYGESPGRALLSLAVLWASFVFLYLPLGLHLSQTPLLSFVSLLPIYTRIQSDMLAQVGGGTKFVSILQGLLGASVLTLFLLALRRRFRR
jgi:hypothetical protein